MVANNRLWEALLVLLVVLLFVFPVEDATMLSFLAAVPARDDFKLRRCDRAACAAAVQ